MNHELSLSELIKECGWNFMELGYYPEMAKPWKVKGREDKNADKKSISGYLTQHADSPEEAVTLFLIALKSRK